ncbi:GGDEF domain-containing protein [Vibrio sp. TBV020]|uniref:GGDEF domain-containing protein n=1 Tax=Vibrio sp. TBV020 TaxID=3137398 RepID=UPI0038CD3519
MKFIHQSKKSMTNYDQQDISADAISDQIKVELLMHGFAWALGAAALFYVTISYYLLEGSTETNNVQHWAIGLSLITTSVYAFGYSYTSPSNKSYWLLPAVLITLSFNHTAFVIYDAYQAPDHAQKLLLIAFLVLLMSWHASRAVLFIGILPTVCFYVVLTSLEPNIRNIDIVVSFAKFPLLLIVFQATVRRYFRTSELIFIEKLKTIHRLKIDSSHDALTKTKNRRGFNHDLVRAIEIANRTSTELSIAIIDIDFFKQYNDALGHPKGDICLEKVSQILKQHCQRASDTVARIGGEEFALIMPATSSANGMTIANRILYALEVEAIPHPDSQITHFVTVSIGVANLEENDDFHSLYERADKAMYRAKATGRNRAIACQKDCQICFKTPFTFYE